MTITERINADLSDIDSKIQFVKDRARAEVASLLDKRAALTQIQALITPELEGAVATLQRFGFLKEV